MTKQSNNQKESNYALIRVSLSAKKQLDQLAATRNESMRQIIDSLLEGRFNPSPRSTRWVNSKAAELGITQQQVLDEVICAYRGQKIADELNAHFIARLNAAEATDVVDDATLVAVSPSLCVTEQ